MGYSGGSGGGGGGFAAAIIKQVDTSRINTTVLAPDPEMQVQVPGPGIYQWVCVANVIRDAGSGGIGISVDVSGGQRLWAEGLQVSNQSATTFGSNDERVYVAADPNGGLIRCTQPGTTAPNQWFRWAGAILVQTAGLVAFEWAQATAGTGPIRIVAGAAFVVSRL